MDKGYEVLGDGRHKIVYGHKGFVIKVPKDKYGLEAIRREVAISRKYGKNNPKHANYARARMLYDTVSIMERVVCVADECEKLPDWCLHIDSSQVGLDEKGRLVAYDFTE